MHRRRPAWQTPAKLPRSLAICTTRTLCTTAARCSKLCSKISAHHPPKSLSSGRRWISRHWSIKPITGGALLPGVHEGRAVAVSLPVSVRGILIRGRIKRRPVLYRSHGSLHQWDSTVWSVTRRRGPVRLLQCVPCCTIRDATQQIAGPQWRPVESAHAARTPPDMHGRARDDAARARTFAR